MSQFGKTRDDHLAVDGAPKRILALDGGGLRGILTLGILERIESLLRERHGGSDDFRLSDYFDLIAGTSTGAIIAASLALGHPVQTVLDTYNQLGRSVFEKSWLRKGLLRAKYDDKKLSAELQAFYGPDTTLGDDALKTGLLVVAKRLDTGSTWPLGNNPRGRYFEPREGGVIGNRDYPLWRVVRASTAAPSFFDPEKITIIESGKEKIEGDFVDGGVSPFNNPALQAVMYATLEGFRVGWPLGAENLLVVSVGTGAADPAVQRKGIAAAHALGSLMSLMNDCATLQETVLQWMSTGPIAHEIDSEQGTLENDAVGGAAQLAYLRYNVDLRPDAVKALRPGTDADAIEDLSEMDAPQNMPLLLELGRAAGARDVEPDHFAEHFDVVPV